MRRADSHHNAQRAARRSTAVDLRSELSTRPGKTSAAYGSRARRSDWAGRSAERRRGRTGQCRQHGEWQSNSAVPLRSHQRFGPTTKSLPCTNSRTGSRRPSGGCEPADRRSPFERPCRLPNRGSRSGSTDTFEQRRSTNPWWSRWKQLALKHSMCHQRPRTGPGRSAPAGSTGCV
jgi:hypothetical protein